MSDKTGTARDKATWNPKTRYDQPLRWRSPRRIFVRLADGDLFQESVPDAFIDRALTVMTVTPHHTFYVLTKHPERMRAYFADPGLYRRVLRASNAVRQAYPKRDLDSIPISNPASQFAPHIWWGVSIEDQDSADRRIPPLLQIPVANHWVSAEPLLGPIDFEEVPVGMFGPLRPYQDTEHRAPRIKWVVVGGESGPSALPMHPDWVISLRDQCQAAGVPFFFKRWGAWLPANQNPEGNALFRSLHLDLDDNLRLDDNHGRTRATPETVVGIDGGCLDITHPQAFRIERRPMLTHRVGALRAGHRLDGCVYQEYPQ